MEQWKKYKDNIQQSLFTEKSKGFTLIEILIVIAIIAILASIVMASLAAARQKANYAVTKQRLRNISTFFYQAQLQNNVRLYDMTNNACSDCPCRPEVRTAQNLNISLKNIPTTDTCYVNARNAIQALLLASSNSTTSATDVMIDNWGSPFLIDENESETGIGDTRRDSLCSAGPDTVAMTPDDMCIHLYFINRSEDGATEEKSSVYYDNFNNA